MHSAAVTALLLAAAFKRGKQTRSRISNKTVETVSGRKRLTASFIVELMNTIVEYDVTMTELDGGGFGLLYTRTLRGAKTLSALNLLTNEELDNPNIEALEAELDHERPDFAEEA